MLVLGPFRGAPTPHTRIPLNQGICGAAASAGKTIVVDDVNSDPRYLSCSLETKSEIVVPVLVNGKVAGELDIDSHSLAAFGAEDRELCQHAAAIVGRYLETRSRKWFSGTAPRSWGSAKTTCTVRARFWARAASLRVMHANRKKEK